MNRLQDRVAFVSGGARGIGEAIVRAFHAEGAKVVVADVRVDQATVVAESLGDRAMALALDVTDETSWRESIAAAVARFGSLDVMVNNAGFTHRNQSMMNVGEDAFDRIFDVNVKAIYLAALEVVPVFRRQGGGAILTTASTAGLRPRPGLTIYNASKGAAIAMTKSMAVEFAPDRIRVNCLCPVAGETAMLADFMGGDTPENRARFTASVPLGRLSLPEDIANAALYLCSDEANFITGTAFEVDGGRCV